MSYNQKPPGPGGSSSGASNAPNNQTPQQVAKTLAGIQQQMQNLVHGQNTLPQTSQADINAFFQQQRIQNMFKQQQQQLLQQHFQQQMQQQQNKDRGGGEPLALTRTPAAAELLNKTYQQHHQQQANGGSVSNSGLASVNQQFQQQLQAFPPNIMQQLQAFQFQMQQQQHPQQSQHPSIQQAHQSQQHQPTQLQVQHSTSSQQQLHGQTQQQKVAAAHMQQLQSLQQKYLSAAAAASQPTVGNKISTTTPPPSLTNQIKPNLPPSTQITPVSVNTGSASSTPCTSKNSTIPSSTVSSVAVKQVPPSISLHSTKPLTAAPSSSVAHQQNKLNAIVNKTSPVVNAITPPFPTQYHKSSTVPAPSGSNNSTSLSHSPSKTSTNNENIISKGNSIKLENNTGNSNNTKPINTSADDTLNSNQATSQSTIALPILKPLQHLSENGNKNITISSSETTNDNKTAVELTKDTEVTLVDNTENKILTDQLKPMEPIKSAEPKNLPESNSKSTDSTKTSEPIKFIETTKSIQPTTESENLELTEHSKSTELIKPTFANTNKSLQDLSESNKSPILDKSITSNVIDVAASIIVKEVNKPRDKNNAKSSTDMDLKSNVPIELIDKEESTDDLKEVTLQKSSEITNADSRQNTILSIDKNNKTEENSKNIFETSVENVNSEEHLKESIKLLDATKITAEEKELANRSKSNYTELSEKTNTEINIVSEVKETQEENVIEKSKQNTDKEYTEGTTENLFENKIKSASSESIITKDYLKEDIQINVNQETSPIETSVKKPGRLAKSTKTTSAVIKKEMNLKYNSRDEKRSLKQKEVFPTSNKKLSDRKSQRHRLKTILYQSPLPELAYITKLSASEASNSPKPMTVEDKLIVFYKNEYMAVRNAEGTFYLCQTMQNVYRTSPRISIRWLSEDKKDSSIYIPDFYDHTDIECVLTTVELKRVDKGHLRLPKTEKSRIESILKKAIDVEKGIVPRPDITEENPDGLDISLYKDESQIEKKNIGDISPSTSSRSARSAIKTVKLSSTLKPVSKRKRTSTIKSPMKKRKILTNRKTNSKNSTDEESPTEESDTEYKPNQKRRASNSTKSSSRVQRSPLTKARAASPITPASSKNMSQTTSPTAIGRIDRANKRKSTIETSHEVSIPTKKMTIIRNKDEASDETSQKKVNDTITLHSAANNSPNSSNTSLMASNLGGTRPTRNRK